MFVGQPNSNRQLQILVSINGIYTQNYLNGKNMIDRVFFWVGFPSFSRHIQISSCHKLPHGSSSGCLGPLRQGFQLHWQPPNWWRHDRLGQTSTCRWPFFSGCLEPDWYTRFRTIKLPENHFLIFNGFFFYIGLRRCLEWPLTISSNLAPWAAAEPWL